MPSPILYALGDLALTSSGRLREATDGEAVLQSLQFLLDERGAVASPLTVERQAATRAAILDMLNQHPRVTQVDQIVFNPSATGANALGVSVYINGTGVALVPNLSTPTNLPAPPYSAGPHLTTDDGTQLISEEGADFIL